MGRESIERNNLIWLPCLKKQSAVPVIHKVTSYFVQKTPAGLFCNSYPHSMKYVILQYYYKFAVILLNNVLVILYKYRCNIKYLRQIHCSNILRHFCNITVILDNISIYEDNNIGISVINYKITKNKRVTGN